MSAAFEKSRLAKAVVARPERASSMAVMTVADRQRMGQETPPSADRVKVGIKVASHLAPNAGASVKCGTETAWLAPSRCWPAEPEMAMAAWGDQRDGDMIGLTCVA